MIGASCGGACPLAATQIFKLHGNEETYENALKKLREHAKTEDGQQDNHLAFVEHLISTYFLSKENFSDGHQLGKELSSVHAHYAALPVLFAVFHPLATNLVELHHIGIRLGLSMSEVNKITQKASFISINERGVVLFKVLYCALKNHSEQLRWSFIINTIHIISPNKQTANAIHKAIEKNSKI